MIRLTHLIDLCAFPRQSRLTTDESLLAICTKHTHIHTFAKHQLNSHMVAVIIVTDN